MICVKLKGIGGLLREIEVRGHAEFAIRGKDTVCAAASGIIQTCALGLLERTGNKALIQRGDGMFRVTLPEKLTDDIRHDCDIIIRTMRLGLCDLERQYPQHIKLEGENHGKN